MPSAPATQTRQDVMREMVQNGISRSEIAREFNVPYGAVYAATKDLAINLPNTSRARIYIDGKPRTEVIREMATSGNYTRRQIATELNIDYAVVWAATKDLHHLDVKRSTSNTLSQFFNHADDEGFDEDEESPFTADDDEDR